MEIHGFQKTTLLDYPGHVAATVFFGGCNFRCPYCHNKDLVLSPSSAPTIEEETVLNHLKKRVGILDGVCITGGEPTLQPDLESLIVKIRSLGYDIKLDTNGSNPQVLKSLCQKNLIDYVAMDIKHTPQKYALVCQSDCLSMEAIMKSVDFLKENRVPYEFRTTITRELHKKEDIPAIGAWLKGASAYYLQAYQESEQVISPVFSSYTYKELQEFQRLLENDIAHVGIRGIDE